jgi:hypothetical protein
MNRRGFLEGILAFGIAPAIVKAEILMPIRQLIVPNQSLAVNGLLSVDLIAREALHLAVEQLHDMMRIDRTYEDSFSLIGASIGDTLRIRMPTKYKGRYQ